MTAILTIIYNYHFVVLSTTTYLITLSPSLTIGFFLGGVGNNNGYHARII